MAREIFKRGRRLHRHRTLYRTIHRVQCTVLYVLRTVYGRNVVRTFKISQSFIYAMYKYVVYGSSKLSYGDAQVQFQVVRSIPNSYNTTTTKNYLKIRAIIIV